MERDTHLRRRDGVLVQQVAEKHVLLDSASGHYYTLNDVGSRVWELADGERSVADIVDVVCGEYDAPRETVETDVIDLLEELRGEKLVVEASA